MVSARRKGVLETPIYFLYYIYKKRKGFLIMSLRTYSEEEKVLNCVCHAKVDYNV